MYKKQLKITKLSRDGGAKNYTRENDKQGASLHHIFRQLCFYEKCSLGCSYSLFVIFPTTLVCLVFCTTILTFVRLLLLHFLSDLLG